MQSYPDGYGVQYDKLLHLTVEPMDGGVKTVIHILNRVSSKSVPKTPYKLWTGRVPSLNHLRVWGSPTEAKVFNPNIEKLDPKIVSCHYISYPEKSKGFCFYYPDRHTKTSYRFSRRIHIDNPH